jgi:hypothetical protein
MTGTLVRIEARHLARSPLLWLGVALAVWSTTLNLRAEWPTLTSATLVAYDNGFLIGAGAVWAGAWLGLRDRVSGAADLITVTPTAPWRLWRARLTSVAALAAGAFAVLSAAALAVSAADGGRGILDLRVLADGALAVVLSGLVGMAVGRLSGSRVVAVLVGPVWYLLCMVAADPGDTGSRRSRRCCGWGWRRGSRWWRSRCRGTCPPWPATTSSPTAVAGSWSAAGPCWPGPGWPCGTGPPGPPSWWR